MTGPRDEMSRVRILIRDWGPLFILIFTVGIAWATMNAKVDQKLDSIRFVADSLHREATDQRQDVLIQQQQVELQESLRRLSQLICYQSPNPACR